MLDGLLFVGAALLFLWAKYTPEPSIPEDAASRLTKTGSSKRRRNSQTLLTNSPESSNVERPLPKKRTELKKQLAATRMLLRL
jgi:hypothetical protein